MFYLVLWDRSLAGTISLIPWQGIARSPMENQATHCYMQYLTWSCQCTVTNFWGLAARSDTNLPVFSPVFLPFFPACEQKSSAALLNRHVLAGRLVQEWLHKGQKPPSLGTQHPPIRSPCWQPGARGQLHTACPVETPINGSPSAWAGRSGCSTSCWLPALARETPTVSLLTSVSGSRLCFTFIFF